jgi:hypothetical protein
MIARRHFRKLGLSALVLPMLEFPAAEAGAPALRLLFFCVSVERLEQLVDECFGLAAEAEDRITIAGQTTTSPGLGFFACWMPKSRKPPVSDKEQTTNRRAVCGRDLHARFGGGSEANQCPVPTSIRQF